MKNQGLYRAMHTMNKGGLHKALGVDPKKSIPPSKLAAAKKSTNSHIAKMASFAETMKGFKHSGPKSKK